MSEIKAGDTAGCQALCSGCAGQFNQSLGGLGFAIGISLLKQTGSERGSDLSKVAQLKTVEVGVERRRWALDSLTPCKHLNNVSSSPEVLFKPRGTVLPLSLGQLFVQLFCHLFDKHLLSTCCVQDLCGVPGTCDQDGGDNL